MASVEAPAPAPDARAAPAPGEAPSGARLAGAFVFVLGAVLASFPARNADVWAHLAGGRAVASGDFAGTERTWLYDLAAYALYAAGGGGALAGAKALAVALAGLLAFGLARVRAGAGPAAACVALALLSAAARAPLQPVAVSYALFALALRLALAPGTRAPRALVAVFAVWANCDQWAPLGLAAVALVWAARGTARGPWLAACAAACAASPAHVGGLVPEIEWASPFARAQLAALGDSVAARAYFALLALLPLAVLAARKRLAWELVAPALVLAALSAASAKLIPFFALVGGPALAWCAAPALERAGNRVGGARAARAAGALAGVALLVAAWAGWVQGAPYGARVWAVEPGPGRAAAAAEVERLRRAGALAPDVRLLHPSGTAARAFRWFAPAENGTADAALLAALCDAKADADPRALLRAARVGGVVVAAGESGRGTELLDRLLIAPDEWPLLHAAGGVAVFGWRDPNGPPGALAGREVDLARLAFRPTAAERLAPGAPPAPGPWWSALWVPIRTRPSDRDEALLLLLGAEAGRVAAPERHARAWAAGQFAGLIGAAPGAPVAALAPRVALLDPPRGPNGDLREFGRVAFALQAAHASVVGAAPAEPLYAAVRAARRATAADPADAAAHLVLGRCYLRLADASVERAWGERFPLLAQLRLVQAAGALNRAAALNPRLAAARLETGALYRRLNCGDLAVTHLRAYRELVARAGGKPDPRASDEVMAKLEELLAKHADEFARESARVPLGDRALMAARRGLAGTALELLLSSDVSAFGTPGMSLELDLLLKTGRGRELLAWATPELRGPLGADAFAWLRAQAHLALGDYAAADVELAAVPVAAAGAPEAAARFARVAGKAALDARPGSHALFDACWRALVESDFAAETGGLRRELANRSDLFAMRGLMALEAGDAERAAELFAEALRFGAADFAARPVAVTGRAWLAAPPP